MVEPKLQRPQFDSGSPTDSLVTTPQPTPDDTVRVSAAIGMLEDDVSFSPFGGASSISFGPLSGGEVSRWDLLALDVTGPSAVLAISVGTPAATLQNFQDSVPPVPPGHIPVAAIQITEVGPAPVIISTSDIVDARAFYHAIQNQANSIFYAPATPGDWVSVPDEVAEALDELADRLNTDVVPTFVGVLSVAGTSKIAARADHQHNHGDLSGLGNVHHDAAQLEYDATTPTDWTNPGMTNPPDIQDALDQLAGSKKAPGVDFTPTVPSDFDTAPTTVLAALDELGARNLEDIRDVSTDEAAAFNAMRPSASADNALTTFGDVSVIEGIDIECATPVIGAREIRLNLGWRAVLSDPIDNIRSNLDSATKFSLFVGSSPFDITPDVTAAVIDEVSAGLVASTHYAIYLVANTANATVGIAVSRDRVTFGFTKPDLSNLLVGGFVPDVFRLIGCATTDGSSDFFVTNAKMGYTHYVDDQLFRSGVPGGSFTNYSAAAFVPPVSTRGVFTAVASSAGGATYNTWSAIGGTTGSSGGQHLGVIFSSSNANSQINNQFEEFLDSNQEMALRHSGAVLSSTYVVNGYYIDLVGQL